MSPEHARTVEQRLRAAVESAPSGLLMTDGAGRIVLVNREIERLFGYSREELLGQSVELLVPERFRGPHSSFRAVFHGDPRIRAMGAGRDLFGRQRDGAEVPIEIGLTPVATEEGLFVLASIVDISARRRADARFRVAVESSPNGMLMVDATGKIILVNRAVERMFGYRREELLGQTVEMLVPERFRRRHPNDRTGFFTSPRERAMGAGHDLFGLRKDNTEFPVEIGLNPIDTEDGLFVLSSIVDISARKKAEEERLELEDQLRQSQKLEAIGTLAGGIAHDFRNILNGIIGYGELIRESVKDRSGANEDLDELMQFAERGKELVSRILTFSRRQVGERKAMPLPQAVAEAVKLLRATLPTTVEIATDLNPVPRVMADATAIHQVITNLATNASQAMPGGGQLQVSLETAYVRDSFARANPQLHEGEYALLTVKDNGQGMDATTRARAFEPFFTTKPAGAGTGLGLAMVHGIMKEHDGAVLLSSELGQGTTVRCYFPAIMEESATAIATAETLPRGGGQRILLVDDEPSLARVGERRLHLLGYQVTPAVSARAALAVFLADPQAFDLVITDFTMPEMNGLELAREITRVRPDLPVVMTTGYIDDFAPGAITDAGVSRLVMKPLNMQDLGRAVADVLGIKPAGES
ncbi:MAG: PAS domain S-box protein [Gemmatimonadales bacterium]